MNRQPSIFAAISPKKTTSSVTYDIYTVASPSTAVATVQLGNLAIEGHTVQDICEFLRPCFQTPSAEGIALETIEDSTTCTHVLRPFPPACSRFLQPTSLRQLITPLRGRPRLENFLLSERIRLARILATAVLQYHSTPWLCNPWRSEDVLFFNLEDETKDSQTLTAPHVNAQIDSTQGQVADSPITSSSHAVTGNSLLFSLGVVFLEIAYKWPWQELRRESDVGKSPDQRLNEFWLVERLAYSGCTGMGQRYDNIIIKLIACDFGFGKDLNKPQLQNAFHDAVIGPLDALEQEMQEKFQM